MILGKFVAVFILLILIIYNSINVRFQPFLLLVVYCISILASFILMLIKSRNIKMFFRKKRQICEMNDNIKVEFVSKNTSTMPITNSNVLLCAQNSNVMYKQKINFVSIENSKTVVSMSISGKHCGVWDVSCVRAYYLDLFKIFKKKIKVPNKCQVVVMPESNYPVEEHYGQLQKIFEDVDIVVEEKGSNVTELVDVRDYMPGDKLNLIHWKMSSKKDKIMVKEFAADVKKCIRLYFNTEVLPDADTIDEAMRVLYSFGLWLLNSAFNFDIITWNGTDAVKVESVNSRAQLQEAIIRLMQSDFYNADNEIYELYKKDCENVLYDCFYITENGIGGDVNGR